MRPCKILPSNRIIYVDALLCEGVKTNRYYCFVNRGKRMTRAEILSDIKRAEEDAKAIVAGAMEAKNRKISEARGQAKEIINKAGEEAAQKAEIQISEARKKIQKEKEEIIKKGTTEAEEIKKKAKKNITKATKFIFTEFERAANA